MTSVTVAEFCGKLMKTRDEPNPAHHLFLDDPWASNSFYIFKQLKDKSKEE